MPNGGSFLAAVVDSTVPANAYVPLLEIGGMIELSTDGDRDGAVEGSYYVTFFWPSDEGAFPKDRLSGLFSRPEASKIKVDVKPQENDLEPFKLTLPARKLKPESDSDSELDAGLR